MGSGGFCFVGITSVLLFICAFGLIVTAGSYSGISDWLKQGTILNCTIVNRTVHDTYCDSGALVSYDCRCTHFNISFVVNASTHVRPYSPSCWNGNFRDDPYSSFVVGSTKRCYAVLKRNFDFKFLTWTDYRPTMPGRFRTVIIWSALTATCLLALSIYFISLLISFIYRKFRTPPSEEQVLLVNSSYWTK